MEVHCFDLTYEGLKYLQYCFINQTIIFVLILPMRDWNSKTSSQLVIPKFSFWSYLWGIEMIWSLPFPIWQRSFDLTYEGLKFYRRIFLSTSPAFVLILPMRDWNFVNWYDPTETFSVLILPMRDWNILSGKLSPDMSAFWSYLWGIEIRVMIEGKTKSGFVLILPMRDWNITELYAVL